MIIGSNEYKSSDLNMFFKDKQLQSKKAAGWTDATFARLGRNNKTFLFEAGMTDKGKDVRKIFKPIIKRYITKRNCMGRHINDKMVAYFRFTYKK